MTKQEDSSHAQDAKADRMAIELCTFLKTNIIDKNITIDPDTSFAKLGIDSLSIIELVLFVERKFNIALPEHELIPENFKSARTLAECALRHADK